MKVNNIDHNDDDDEKEDNHDDDEGWDEKDDDDDGGDMDDIDDDGNNLIPFIVNHHNPMNMKNYPWKIRRYLIINGSHDSIRTLVVYEDEAFVRCLVYSKHSHLLHSYLQRIFLQDDRKYARQTTFFPKNQELGSQKASQPIS